MLALSTPLGRRLDLPGPTGEANSLRCVPRGRALCVAADHTEALLQLAAALATGNEVVLVAPDLAVLLARLPALVRQRATAAEQADSIACDVALCTAQQAAALRRLLAARDGARVRVVTAEPRTGAYALEALVVEQTITVNTAAAGGNASLLTLEPT